MSDEKLIDVIANVPAAGAGGTVGTLTATRIVETVKAHEAANKPKQAEPKYEPPKAKLVEPKYIHPDPKSRGQKG